MSQNPENTGSIRQGMGGNGAPFDPLDFVPKAKHKCSFPDAESFNAPAGWRCDCGKAYRRVQESQHGETWWQWERMPTADHSGRQGTP